MRRAAVVALACLIIGFVWGCFPAAGAEPGCHHVDAFLQKAQASEGYLSHIVLSGKERDTANEIFNALPPESDRQFPTMVMVSFKNGAGAVVAGPQGLVCTMMIFDKQQWGALMRSIRGTSS